MVYAYVGTPGSGKSYAAIKMICECLIMGRVVFTNIRGIDDYRCRAAIQSICKLSYIAMVKQLHFLSNEEIMHFWNHVSPGSLIVIDEIHLFFDARQWSSTENNLLKNWASVHRHHGYDLVCITQSTARVDSSVRSLFEWCYEFRKINYFGSLVKNKYTCNSFDSDDTSGKPLAQDTHSYDSRYFKCYGSYANNQVKELATQKHVNVLKHPIFYAIPLLLCFLVYMVSKSSLGRGDLFGVESINKNNQLRTSSLMHKSDVKNDTQTGSVSMINKNGMVIYTNRVSKK